MKFLTNPQLDCGFVKKVSVFTEGMWQKLSGAKPEHCAVVYGGDNGFQTSSGKLIGWRGWDGQMSDRRI